MTRSLLARLLAVSISVAVVGVTTIAEAGVPHGTQVLTPTGPATTRDGLTLLTGSDTELVYVSRPTVAVSLQFAAEPPPANGLLQARSASGVVRTLGPVVAGDGDYSTRGDVVSASVEQGGSPTNQVDVWLIHTGGPQRLTLPTGGTVSAGPHGVIYGEGGTLRLRRLSGSDTDYGTPFPGQTPTSVAVDSAGLVVAGTAGGVAFMRFDHPGTYQQLDSGTTSGIRCVAVDAEGAGCETDNGDAVFVPLNGGSPTSAPACLYSLGLSGTTLFSTCDDSDETQLASLSVNGQTAASKRFVGLDLVSAYGKVLDHPEQGFNVIPAQVLAATTTASDLRTLFVAPRSPETAGAFSLTSGRIVYVSDRLASHDRRQRSAVRSAAVHATRQHASVGAVRVIGGRLGNSQVKPYAIAQDTRTVVAAGPYTAYQVGNFNTYSGDLRLVSAHATRTLHPSYDGDTLDMTSRWLLWSHAGPNGHNALILRNLRTGHTRRLFRDRVPVAAALADDAVVFAGGQHGYGHQVHRRNLRTGRTSVVAVAPAGFRNPTVVAHGHWAAWAFQPRNREAAGFNGVRNLRTGRVIRLSHIPYALNAQGAVLKSTTTAVSDRTWFRPYSGGLHSLLSSRLYDEMPQLIDHAIAWVSIDGNLKVAPYRY